METNYIMNLPKNHDNVMDSLDEGECLLLDPIELSSADYNTTAAHKRNPSTSPFNVRTVVQIVTPLTLLNLLFLMVNLKYAVFDTMRTDHTNHKNRLANTSHMASSSSNDTSRFVRYDKIFGHVHMAKTAGTEINGELAAHYERVCGHKGYSYDAVQFNQRIDKKAKKGKEVRVSDGGPDIISGIYEGYNRGRVPPGVMDEIGYEDCDYVSLESHWSAWRSVAQVWPLELHVPCRDPLEHLMSQCNHRHKKFDCNATNLRQQVQSCLVKPERFHANLTQVANLTLKCFNPSPMQPYLEYMDPLLERKRIQTPYIHRDSNQPRHKEKECIWENSKVAHRVRQILLGYDYYQWCDGCMGGENDLLLRRTR